MISLLNDYQRENGLMNTSPILVLHKRWWSWWKVIETDLSSIPHSLPARGSHGFLPPKISHRGRSELYAQESFKGSTCKWQWKNGNGVLFSISNFCLFQIKLLYFSLDLFSFLLCVFYCLSRSISHLSVLHLTWRVLTYDWFVSNFVVVVCENFF